MTEAPTKREQAKEERRGQILEAALAVFSEKGYHATNVSDVAARAGVSQGTIYWYFDSKDELFEAAVLSFFDQFGAEAVVGILEQETATEKLRAFSRSMAQCGDVAQNLFTLFLGYWASSPDREGAAKTWTNLLAGYKDMIVEIVEEGVQNGEFKPLDAESLAWMIMAAYDGLAAYMLLLPELDVDRISDVFVETLLSGILVGGASMDVSGSDEA